MPLCSPAKTLKVCGDGSHLYHRRMCSQAWVGCAGKGGSHPMVTAVVGISIYICSLKHLQFTVPKFNIAPGVSKFLNHNYMIFTYSSL